MGIYLSWLLNLFLLGHCLFTRQDMTVIHFWPEYSDLGLSDRLGRCCRETLSHAYPITGQPDKSWGLRSGHF